MSTLVVLANVAALAAAFGLVLSRRLGGGRRHGGGSPVVPRALVTLAPLLVGIGALWAFRERNELLLSGIALWWAGLPWLAFTGRLSAWAHAAWSLAVNGGAAGLVFIAWLITTTGLSVPVALGSWALWATVTAAFVLFARWSREAAAPRPEVALEVERVGRAALRARRDAVAPKPAYSAVWLCGAVSAIALALVLQPGLGAPGAGRSLIAGPHAPEASETTAPGEDTTPAATPDPGATTSAPPATTAPTPRTSTTSVARKGQRTTTSAPVTTTTPTPDKPRRTKKPKPTGSPTTSTDDGGLFTFTFPAGTRKRPSPTTTSVDD
ncbi:MAG TPA: hypothetical protein VH915_10900 [Pedococcus sp.]